MKSLSNSELQATNGGDFCTGFEGAILVYGAGMLANWWNPAGQTATAIALGIGAACWLDII